MDSLRELGRTLLFIAGILALVGAFCYFGGKLPFRLGRLPGDIVHESEHSTFYFPLTTSILLNVGLSLILLLISRFRRFCCRSRLHHHEIWRICSPLNGDSSSSITS